MKTEVQKKTSDSTEVASVQPEAVRRVLFAPVARVSEGEDGYELRVELPGVEEQALHVGVEDRTLTIEGETADATRAGYRLVREECPPARYRAVYELPERVDTAGIKARLSNGVLHLQLPKREEVKPRRIEVRAA